MVFSSPEPKAQDELLWSLAIRPYLWTTSPLKSLGQLYCVPLLKGGLKIYTNGQGLLTKMAIAHSEDWSDLSVKNT